MTEGLTESPVRPSPFLRAEWLQGARPGASAPSPESPTLGCSANRNETGYSQPGPEPRKTSHPAQFYRPGHMGRSLLHPPASSAGCHENSMFSLGTCLELALSRLLPPIKWAPRDSTPYLETPSLPAFYTCAQCPENTGLGGSAKEPLRASQEGKGKTPERPCWVAHRRPNDLSGNPGSSQAVALGLHLC
jgi:hypothetical protein